MSHEQRNKSNPLTGLFKTGGNLLSDLALRNANKAIAGIGRRLTGRIILQGLKTGLKAVLIKTAPIWLPLLVVLLIAFLAFLLIYAIPKTIAEDSATTMGDRVAGFFGFSDDEEGWEDIFEVYEETAARWSEGLTEEQTFQAETYALSWSVLAAVDRIRNDPYIKTPNGGPIMIVDGENISVDGIFPPNQFIPIYMQAAKTYNVDWQVLSALHHIESTYSSYPVGGTSSAGARGPLQFMPCTWVGWSHSSCSGKGKGSFTDAMLSDVSLIKKHKGYGVDASGDGRADIWNEIDAIHAAAKYLSSSGYSRDRYKAIWHYNHADWYVQKVLQTAEMIHQMYEIRKEKGEVEEYDLDELNIKRFSFFDLTDQDKMITPRPEETFAALRPIFTWNETEEVWTWEEYICVSSPEGVVSCSWVSRSKTKKIVLLAAAETYQGTYTHHYKKEKLEQPNSAISTGGRIRNVFVTRDNLNSIETPTEEEYMQPFYEYLRLNGIVQELDIDLVFELMEMFDLYYVKLKENLDSLFVDNYPTIEGSNSWIWPTPSTRITSRFGPRASPCKGCSTFHKGTDVGGTTAGVAGDPVWAMEDGRVESAYYSNSGGNMVVINHGNGIKSRYLHLSSLAVRTGQPVTKSTLIGRMGKTGSAGNGVHLHFEIHINGKPYDPLGYFPQIK